MYLFKDLPDLVGLLGVLLILIAYAMLHLSIWRAETLSYSVLNVIGSILIIFSLFYAWNLSAFVMELTWLLLSLYGLLRYALKSRTSNPRL